MKNTQHGFAGIAVIVILAIALGAGGAYYVKNKPKVENPTTAQDAAPNVYTEGMGYKFKTPWGKGEISSQTKNSAETKQFVFNNGKKILLTCSAFSPREELKMFASENESTEKEIDQMLAYLGTKADSGYEFTKYLLTLDENSVKSSKDQSETEILSTLLEIKSMTMSSPEKIKPFQKGSVKGFQFGDYSTPQDTELDIYVSDNNRCKLLSPESDNLSQADVDLIISTFSKI